MKIWKRISALCLAALFCFPMAVSAAEKTPFEKGERGTWYAYVWHETSGAPNLFRPFGITVTNSLQEYEGNFARDGALVTAQRMKAYLDKMPDGRRALNPNHLYAPIRDIQRRKAANYYWIDDAVQEVCDNLNELLYYYNRLGGKPIDAFVSDLEQSLNVWYLEIYPIQGIATMEEIFDSITADPRYETEIRPQLIEYGITLYEGNDHNEMYNMYANMNNYAANDPRKADVYKGIRYADERTVMYLNRVYDVLKKYYPDIKCSDYGHKEEAQPNTITTDYGHMYGLFTETLPVEEREYKTVVGTHSSWPNYGNVRDGLIQNPPPGYPYETYLNTPYNGILYQIITMQNVVTFREDSKMQPWVGCYTYGYNCASYPATDYYDELIYHFAMGNPDPFLFYNWENMDYGLEDNLYFSELLLELDDLLGFEDRKTLITDLTPWDSHYILNGMYAGGKNVWRITPDLYIEGMTIDNFKVKDKPLTFQIADQIVEFPEGSYIYSPGEGHSQSGYWVISPEGTRPTERRDSSIAPAKQPQDYVFEGIEVIQDRVDAILGNAGEKTEEGGAQPEETPAVQYAKSYKDIFVSQNKADSQ